MFRSPSGSDLGRINRKQKTKMRTKLAERRGQIHKADKVTELKKAAIKGKLAEKAAEESSEDLEADDVQTGTSTAKKSQKKLPVAPKKAASSKKPKDQSSDEEEASSNQSENES